MSNVKEKWGGVGRLHGLDTMVLMTSTRFGGHGDWGLRAEVVGPLVWWVPLGGEEWFWLCFWLWLLVVFPLGGGGWRVVMLGGVPGGAAVHLSLGWFDTGENNDLHRISFACSNPFRMCHGGGSSLGRLQADWR